MLSTLVYTCGTSPTIMLSAMAASELTFMLRDMPGIISRMLAVSLRFTLYRDWFMPDEERVEQNSLYTLPAGVKVTLIRGPRPVR